MKGDAGLILLVLIAVIGALLMDRIGRKFEREDRQLRSAQDDERTRHWEGNDAA